MEIPAGKQDGCLKLQADEKNGDILPSYDDVTRSGKSSSSGTTRCAASTAGFQTGSLTFKSTNFLHLTHKSIKGSYTIDPLMTIPDYLLPPLLKGEQAVERKNVSLSTWDGSIDVDISLAGRSTEVQHKRTTLYLKSNDGWIHAKIRKFNNTVPFLLDAKSRDGCISIHIPRTFHGLVSMATQDLEGRGTLYYGKFTLSDALLESSTLLPQVGAIHRYFIGDISALNDNVDEKWSGDELRLLTANGNITIKYAEENQGTQRPARKSGFLGRMFGL